MGHESKQKAERRHTKKAFGGRSAQEVYRTLAFPAHARCECGSAKIAIRARSFAPLDGVLKEPAFAMHLASQNGGQLPVVDFTSGKYVRIGVAYACDGCRKSLQVTAAKAPSWVCVEFDECPDQDRVSVQV